VLAAEVAGKAKLKRKCLVVLRRDKKSVEAGKFSRIPGTRSSRTTKYEGTRPAERVWEVFFSHRFKQEGEGERDPHKKVPSQPHSAPRDMLFTNHMYLKLDSKKIFQL
jgi:hypothetical protein